MNLQNEWYSLCKRLSLGPEQTGYLTHIKIGYSEQHRFYHTLEHVRDCLMLYHKTMHLTEFPIAIEVAIWFHDLVYDPLAKDNEVQSAERCMEWMRDGGLNQQLCEEVYGLILATDHRTVPELNDQRIMADIDLSILGSEPEVYQSYSDDIRKEYASIPDREYGRGRRAVLEGFVGRPTLFQNEIFIDAFGTYALENIRSELAALNAGQGV